MKKQDIEIAVGQKWKNRETNIHFWIVEISNTLVSIDDRKKKLSSIDHMNKSLWHHLVNQGVFEFLE